MLNLKWCLTPFEVIRKQFYCSFKFFFWRLLCAAAEVKMSQIAYFQRNWYKFNMLLSGKTSIKLSAFFL